MATMTLAELAESGERDLGTSDWIEVTQEQVNLFADATNDHQWIHVDPEAAAKGPFGRPIAHGFLTLSLLPGMLAEILHIPDQTMGVNYGVEKVRFTSPVPVGSRIRAHGTLLGSEPKGGGLLNRVAVQVEIEGEDKPAMVGEALLLAFGEPK